MHNVSNHPAVQNRKEQVAERAAAFAKEAKIIFGRPKRLVLLDLMRNFGIKIQQAREIYRGAK